MENHTKKFVAIILFLLASGIQAQDYFPLKVGNSWTFSGSYDTTHKWTYSIKDTLNIYGQKYFLFGSQNYPVNDTLRKDDKGNIWKLHEGIPYLWLDFTKDNDSVYYYPSFFMPEPYHVTTRKYLTIDTYVKTFNNCIELFFNVPDIVDDEDIYTFAPDVGLIKHQGAKSDELLYSAYINDIPLNVKDNFEKIPSTPTLSQNYPNPFNPTTTIEYTIPTIGTLHATSLQFVTLKIYNILGQESATLVNEYQRPGKYTVQFNAETRRGESLPCGIYFYTLRVRDFSTLRSSELQKKMLLLK